MSEETGTQTGITDDDRYQIQQYLLKHPTRRSVDDLRPTAAVDDGDDD